MFIMHGMFMMLTIRVQILWNVVFKIYYMVFELGPILIIYINHVFKLKRHNWSRESVILKNLLPIRGAFQVDPSRGLIDQATHFAVAVVSYPVFYERFSLREFNDFQMGREWSHFRTSLGSPAALDQMLKLMMLHKGAKLSTTGWKSVSIFVG